MRARRSVGVVCAAVLALAGGLSAGCQRSAGGGGGKPTASQSPLYGAQFLGVDECSSFGRTSFTEVPCTGERAAARVIARYDGTVSDGPLCPATTDFVLHISGRHIPQGYACMRNLEPPHPGDPGAGGGPRTIAGDCVYGVGKGEVRETACDGSGPHKPQYKVMRAVTIRANCPATTALYVQLGGRNPIGCARSIR